MKLWNRLGLLLTALTLTALCCVVFPKEAQAATIDDLTYTVSNSEVTITDCSTSATGELVIPDTIEDCPVTKIGTSTFRDCSSLTSVTIPDSVTTIGTSAFNNCTGLTSVTIGNSVTAIAERAFRNCTSLASVTIPDSVTTIGTSAFNNCTGLTSVTIGNSVTAISRYVFRNCTSLTNVTIPDGVTNIGTYAFSNCSSLAYVTIPDSVTIVGNYAFYNCGSLMLVTYCGTTEQWDLINIADNNNELSSASRVYHAFAEATCTTPKNCNICGTVEGEALGHSYWEVVTVPTCTGNGYTTITCSVCEDVIITDYVAATGHSNESIVTVPTCTEQGYTINTCTVCSEVTLTDYVDAKGHNWSTWIQTVAPTCTTEGSQWRFCDCGTKETQTLEKLAHIVENGICTVCRQPEYYYWILSADMVVEMILTQDLYVDLNGYDMSGTIVTNGYQVYGMDSTTNTYSCDDIGYFSCTNENGNVIVPVRHFKTDETMTGDIRRYMTVSTDTGYTFHRFYLGITSTSLKPDIGGVGYKAVFHGNDVVKSQLDLEQAFGYTLQLEGFDAISRYKTAAEFESGKTVTLRINNYDAESYGETALYASVYMQMSDSTLIQSMVHTITLRQLLESINNNYISYSDTQLSALKELIDLHPVMKNWSVENLYKTAADILADAALLAEGESLGYYAILTGKVTAIGTPYDSEYSNISVYMDVDGTELCCYRMKSGVADASGIRIGDTISVRGILMKYKGAVEFQTGCTLEMRVEGYNPGDYMTPEEIVDAAYVLESGASLEGQYALTGVISSVDTAYSSVYKNVTVTMKVANREDYPIQCYRMVKGAASVEDLAVGDTITVTGTIYNQGGRIRFYQFCVLDAVVKGTVDDATDGSTDSGNTDTGGTETEDTETNGDSGETETTVQELVMVTDIQTDTAYKLYVEQETIGKNLYFAGCTYSASQTYYMATTEDASAATDVYLEAVDGGYRLFFMDGTTKTYLDMYLNGTHYDLRLTDAPTAVYTYDNAYNTLVATIEGTDCYMGTSGSYTVVSCSKYYYITSSTSYAVHLGLLME